MNPQNITYANFDRIEEYLFDRMTAEERTVFENEVAQNPQLADELQQQQLEHQAMELMHQAELRKQFQAWDREGVSEKATSKIVEMPQYQATESRQKAVNTEGGTPVRRFTIFQFAAAAAMLIAVAFVGIRLFSGDASGALADDFFQQTASTIRGNSTMPADLVKAESLIKNKDFQGGLTILNAINGETAQAFPDKIQLLKGECQFKLKQYDAAIQAFQQVAKTGVAAANKEQADWFLVLTYLAAKDKKGEFDAALANILSQPNHSFYGQSVKLKAKI
jgi:tetratricopeptide (TPR) repeat protein